jgi:hypothetical protein
VLSREETFRQKEPCVPWSDERNCRAAGKKLVHPAGIRDAGSAVLMLIAHSSSSRCAGAARYVFTPIPFRPSSMEINPDP